MTGPTASGRGRARRRGRAPRGLVLAAAALAATGLGGCTARYGVPESAATQGDDFLFLWRIFVPIAIVVVLLIWVLVLLVVIRGRRWRRAEGEPSQHQYDGKLEVAYLVSPLIVVAILFGLSTARTADITRLDPNPQLEVEVQGFQWSWSFIFLDRGVAVTGVPGSVPVLRLPLGQTVQFDLVTVDVIHSFWVPEFLTKRDLVPGIDNAIDITPTRVGRWTSRCAEYCGLNHTDMIFTVEVMEPDAFEAWLDDAAAGRVDDVTLSTVPATTRAEREAARG